LLFLNRHRFQPKFFGIAISLLALIIVIGGIAIPDDYFERQSLLVAEEKDTSLLRRAAYIRVAIDSFFENPILGTGTGTFPKIWIQSREAMFFRMVERPTHNVYLQVLVDTGLIGFLIYLGLLFQVFKDILRSIQNYALKGIQRLEEIGISYLICFLVVSSYGLIRNTLDDKLFLLIISLSQVFYFISNSEQQLKDDSDL
jgi:O-antigen ligase